MHDEQYIQEMLVTRDTEAFCAGDWDRVAEDFDEGAFLGIRGGATPADWRPEFSSLAAYRDSWLDQSRELRGVELRGESLGDFLLRASRIERIEMEGDRALALKVFDGRASTISGEELHLSWQTVYLLRRCGERWKITGFIGYLPHPGRRIHRPGSEQHRTAGPYSPVLQVDAGPLVAISGHGPIDGEGRIVGQTIEEQARFTLENCHRQLAAAGCGFADVFKVNVYLKDMADWERFNAVYREFFREPYPARTAIQAVLWGGILVEVEMLAAPRAASAGE